MNSKDLFCRELPINSAELKIPRTTYQRELNEDRVRRIAAEFDERIANEPKVSCRDGRYYVFDGQHTIAARKLLNGGRDLPIRCKVFYGLTESDEALLFAQQTGASASLTAGAKFRALVYGGDEDAMAFLKATEAVGPLCGLQADQGREAAGLHQHRFRPVPEGRGRGVPRGDAVHRGRLEGRPRLPPG